MAGIKDLNDYEKRFFDVMKARDYKSSVVTDDGGFARGVLLTHPNGTFRFRVEGRGFAVETPTIRTQGYGRRHKEVRRWYNLKNVFTKDEMKEFQETQTLPDMGDLALIAKIEQTIKTNEEEQAMKGVREARRMALREAAPDMWRALRVITLDLAIKDELERLDPQALKQCQDAVINAGSQDPDDLSVARSGLAQSQHDTVG